MKKIFFTILALLISSSAFSYPLNIDVKKKHELPLEIENFKYWYGDIEHGYLIYLGNEDVAGFETELHLYFLKKKISKSIMILGPAGLDSMNCLRKYKNVLSLLNKKYGHFTYQKSTKDPIIDDLVTADVCTPVRVGLYTIDTYWKSKEFQIIATLLGDEEGIYIEIEYIFDKQPPKNKLKKIL